MNISSQNNSILRDIFTIPVIVSALGYFVDECSISLRHNLKLIFL